MSFEGLYQVRPPLNVPALQIVVDRNDAGVGGVTRECQLNWSRPSQVLWLKQISLFGIPSAGVFVSTMRISWLTRTKPDSATGVGREFYLKGLNAPLGADIAGMLDWVGDIWLPPALSAIYAVASFSGGAANDLRLIVNGVAVPVGNITV